MPQPAMSMPRALAQLVIDFTSAGKRRGQLVGGVADASDDRLGRQSKQSILIEGFSAAGRQFLRQWRRAR